MIYDQIDFFNVEEINCEGQILRFKENLIQNLGCEKHHRGRFYGYRSIGVELRFVMESAFFDLKLKSYKEETKVYVFIGEFMHQTFSLKEGVITNIHVEIPDKIKGIVKKVDNFAPSVIRVVIGYSGYVSYHGLNTYGNRRPPNNNEIPSKTLLVYGSSISHGSEALDYIDSYAFLLSRLLKMNVLNKAIPGSCQAEKIMAQYLKTITCDKAFYEFGVNVIDLFDLSDYEGRLKYLLDNLPTKDYLYTSILVSGNTNPKIQEFKKIASNYNSMHYLEPDLLLSDIEYLTTDLLHPANFGQMMIALNLAKYLKG